MPDRWLNERQPSRRGRKQQLQQKAKMPISSLGGLDEVVYDSDVVTVRPGRSASDCTEISISCPDVLGLGGDIARIVYEFGLLVAKGDLSTDKQWCFIVLFVRLARGAPECPWQLLKRRLESVCPVLTPSALSYSMDGMPPQLFSKPEPRSLFMMQVCATDRCGILNDLTMSLWREQLRISKVHVSTSPDQSVVDLFFVTDDRDELPDEKRADQICETVQDMLRDDERAECIILPAPPSTTATSPGCCDDILKQEPHLEEWTLSARSKTSVLVDSQTSRAHTMLWIRTPDRKGLLYDLLRTTKDIKIRIAYAKIDSAVKHNICEMSLLMQDANGLPLPEKTHVAVAERLKASIDNPIRIACGNKGEDAAYTELLVVTSVDVDDELGVRPRVLLDVTTALKELGVSIFSADIRRLNGRNGLEEVHRFLVTERDGQPIMSAFDRATICRQVRALLLG